VNPASYNRIAHYQFSADFSKFRSEVAAGSLFLLIFGRGLSNPYIVFTCNLLSMLMDRNPVTIYWGPAILWKVGGEMTITNPAIVGYLDASKFLQYLVEAGSEIGIRIIMQS
jgi:predicted tellurium resistance membrane protein TerC